MKQMIIILLVAFVIGAAVTGIVIAVKSSGFKGTDYTIPELDLSEIPDELKNTEYEYLYNLSVVDNSKDYMAHPDSVLLKNGNIFTVYPAGHGKGAVLNKVSTDNGVSWSETVDRKSVV